MTTTRRPPPCLPATLTASCLLLVNLLGRVHHSYHAMTRRLPGDLLTSPFVCLLPCLHHFLLVCLFFCLPSVCLSVSLLECLLTSLSTCLFIRPPTFFYTSMLICLFCLPVSLVAYLCACLSSYHCLSYMHTRLACLRAVPCIEN